MYGSGTVLAASLAGPGEGEQEWGGGVNSEAEGWERLQTLLLNAIIIQLLLFTLSFLHVNFYTCSLKGIKLYYPQSCSPLKVIFFDIFLLFSPPYLMNFCSSFFLSLLLPSS